MQENLKFAYGQSIHTVERISNSLDKLIVFFHPMPRRRLLVPQVCCDQIFGGVKESGGGGAAVAGQA